MKSNPHNITKDFEKALCEYTGSRYAVAVTSCTMALLLACRWAAGTGAYEPTASAVGARLYGITIPSRTYVSVPQSIIHAGFKVGFEDYEWSGMYQLEPLPVWDSARRFTSSMYVEGQFQCVSFHSSKILADTQGGAILHDNDEADAWFRRARFDGRTEGVAPKDDTFDMVGWHAYMSPDVAARLLFKLSVLPKHNHDLPNDEYPDLSLVEAFR